MMHEERQQQWPMPRGKRRYLPIKADRVEDDAWMSQPDAARYLGMTLVHIGMLLANRHLIPAENPAGCAGVTTVSVEAEKAWRAHATIRARSVRLLKDTINWF